MSALRRRARAVASVPCLTLVASVACLALIASVGCTRASDTPFGRPVAISGSLPRLEGATVQGGRLDPSALRGHPVVVNFWATWCGPCEQEQPALQRVWTRYRAEGVRVIGVNFNDDAAAAAAWIHRFGVTYPSVKDPAGAYADDFGFPGLPATYVADASGRLRYRIYGAVTEPLLDRLLAKVTASTP